MVPSALDDPDRLAVLADLAILDTPAEPAYDDIARLAAVCCHSDIAAVNFVDDHRHWTKAIVGVEDGQGSSVAADISFCSATVQTPGGMLSVPDTTGSDEWRSHPFVTGTPHLRFYAGAAIVVAGQPVGVVCVFGDEPRSLSDEQEEALVALARQASAHLELRSRNAELRELAVSDPLTGLANRTLLLDRLALAIAERERGRGDVGVLYCDVDAFKQVNDHLGHAAGDQLLRQIADRLRAATRPTDTVARIAGDEFVVVCPGLASAAEFDTVAERITHLANAAGPDGVTPPRLSVGAAFFEDGDTASSVLHRADTAMYRAKPARDAAASGA
ncbi:MAG: diguanylate cyclase domain-containing protein [Solirubrobacteraceae bacterium]